MEGIYAVLVKVSKILSTIASAALTFMMFLTVADVLGRATGFTIQGTYEIIGLCLAVVVGFGLPKVSLDKAHVFMEFLVDRFGPTGRKVMNTFTRVLSLAIFLLIGYNLLTVGTEFRASGEVSSILRIPFFPVPFAEGICCFVLCLVFVCDIVRIWRDQYE
jgi:TRAP-type C4-dicarboxylate transport system permease small subunit